MSEPIWTLEARDSVMLEVMASYFDLSPEAIRAEIGQAHRLTIEAIAAKGVPYGRLRNALVPRRDRLERAFLFDTDRIDQGWYGLAVAEALIPLIPRQLSCSIQLGDLIIDDQDLAFELLRRHVVPHRRVELGNTNQIYCVYLNNLTPTMADAITAGLEDYTGFAGHVDTSVSSPFKDWLSLTLVDGYLKYRGLILNGHEDDVPDSEDLNLKGWPWEPSGYAVRSIRDMYFHLLLGYKIERRVLPAARTDTNFALISISGRALDLADLEVEVDEAKGRYIREKHGSGLARAGLGQVGAEELGTIIKEKIEDSYIYNLRHDVEHDASLFNIMLEVSAPDGGPVTRLLAGLEYLPESESLKLVTLF
jgi:hypothetical protein